MKICGHCKIKKVELEFTKHSCNNDGLSYWCRSCSRSVNKKWYSRNPLKIRENKLFAKFGITLNNYDNMLVNQNYVCAICLLGPSGKKKHLSIDHDHKTGKVRGLLCDNCNRKVVATIEAYPHLIGKGIEYLEKYNV